MSNRTQALHDYLVRHSDTFAEEWFSMQNADPGSDYSQEAPETTKRKMIDQSSQYFRYIADALIVEEQVSKEMLSDWTNFTAADRIQSTTTLEEVIKSNKSYRRKMWEVVQRFTKETDLPITINDLFEWEEKLNKALDFTLESFTYHYMNLLMDRLASQASLINELSTPVISITSEIGLLPIIGDIDTDRIRTLIDSAMEQSVSSGISVLIIDLSGVYMIDTMVAQQLFQLIDALRLIGLKTILTGIRPEVAQTAVQLGLSFEGVQTENSLQNIFRKLSPEQIFN